MWQKMYFVGREVKIHSSKRLTVSIANQQSAATVTTTAANQIASAASAPTTAGSAAVASNAGASQTHVQSGLTAGYILITRTYS